MTEACETNGNWQEEMTDGQETYESLRRQLMLGKQVEASGKKGRIQ
jgi:hypothetical protein